jgi:putative oxygen-independent coproporphyrinogen III oxidase
MMGGVAPPLGVYLHIPYCAARCDYCDFAVTLVGDRRAWAPAAIAELALAPPDRPVDTVFFGGGTPTLVPPADLAEVLRAIDLAPGAEVTVEANPETVGPRSLAALRQAGVTRISIGMQSAAPHVLRALGRTHDAVRAPQAAREARAAGFEHVSLDLIYGGPGERDEDWRASLEAALAAEPDHVSAYALTIAPGTRLHARIRHGLLDPPDEGALADRYLLADALLGEAGLGWYEVSNWARTPQARSRHTLGYWRGGDWLAIGPGAHGHIDGHRWWNVRRTADWAALVTAGRRPVKDEEVLTAEQRRLERIMLELRTREGLDLAVLGEGALPSQRAPLGEAGPLPSSGPLGEVGSLAEEGLVTVEGRRAVLTLRGRLLADLVTRRLAAPVSVAA